jgi:LmbE family N-acetylglucosaminyl deacetylase
MTGTSSFPQQIYLAPHLDDAALSCGGMIAAAVAAGQNVLVVNICTGSSPPDQGYGPLAQILHHQWGLDPAAAMQARMSEDQAALAILGADWRQLDLLDAIYRMPAAYVDDPTLFGAVHPADPLGAQLRPHLQALVARFPQAQVYAPLGIGMHVDHQIVHTVTAELEAEGASVHYYEDFPYVHWPGAIDQRWQALGGSERFTPQRIAIDTTIDQRITAIKAYRSQIAVLFGTEVAAAVSVERYAARVAPAGATYGEQVWSRR